MPDKDDWMRTLEIDLAQIEAQIEEISRAVGKRVPEAPTATDAAAAQTAPAAGHPDAAPPAPGARSLPVAGTPADTAAPPAPRSLLDELRETAQAMTQQEAVVDHARREREARLNKRLREFFRYLGEFSRHLDTIHPPVPGAYRFNAQTLIDGLHWKDSFVDSRAASLSETAPLVMLQLRYTLAGAGQFVISRDIAQSGVFQNELTAMDMIYTVRDLRSAAGKLIAQEFVIDRAVKVTLTITPDYETDTLLLRTRNLDDFGAVDYSCSAEWLGAEFFDEFGRYLLRRPSKFIQLLKADGRLRP